MAELTVFPAAISSLIRANTMTFASTAIPIPRIIPAIPGSVRVISNQYTNAITSDVYIPSPTDAANPEIPYITIMKSITSARPIPAAFIDDERAAPPSWAPSTFDSNS